MQHSTSRAVERHCDALVVGGFAAGVLLIKLFEKRELTYAKRHKIKLTRSDASRLEW